MAKAKVFAVLSRKIPAGDAGHARLVKAGRASQVREHVLKDYDIHAASAEEANDLGRAGVAIDDLTAPVA